MRLSTIHQLSKVKLLQQANTSMMGLTSPLMIITALDIVNTSECSSPCLTLIDNQRKVF